MLVASSLCVSICAAASAVAIDNASASVASAFVSTMPCIFVVKLLCASTFASAVAVALSWAPTCVSNSYVAGIPCTSCSPTTGALAVRLASAGVT